MSSQPQPTPCAYIRCGGEEGNSKELALSVAKAFNIISNYRQNGEGLPVTKLAKWRATF